MPTRPQHALFHEVELDDKQREAIVAKLKELYPQRASHEFVSVTLDFVVPSKLPLLNVILDLAAKTGALKVPPSLQMVFDERYLSLVWSIKPINPTQKEAGTVLKGVQGNHRIAVRSIIAFAMRLLDERQRTIEQRRTY